MLEASEEAAVINEWDSEPAEAFLVMSGNWLDVLLRYLQFGRIEADSVYMIHMDVGTTPSWFRFANLTVFPHLRVYDEDGVNYRFEYPELEKRISLKTRRKKNHGSIFMGAVGEWVPTGNAVRN